MIIKNLNLGLYLIIILIKLLIKGKIIHIAKTSIKNETIIPFI